MKEMPSKIKTKLRKDDKVTVIAGNHKGKTGKILRINDDRVVIQGVNMRKKHVKATQTSKGGIIELEGSVHISNVMLSHEDGRPVKLRTKVNESGERSLYYKVDGEEKFYRNLHK